jgi:hypothetical protein
VSTPLLRNPGRGVLGAIVVMALTGVLAPASARAQEPARVVSSVRHGPGTGVASPITKRGVERYCELLEFSPEQSAAAMAIFEGSLVGRRAADEVKSKAHQEAIKEMREGRAEPGPSRLDRVNEAHFAEISKIEKTFFADLRSLCVTPAQESNWARVERARRREVELRRGSVNGEAVDLFVLVHRLRLPSADVSGVRPLLEDYEVEVDGHLKARQRIAGETPAFDGGNVSMEAVRKRLAEVREAGALIRDLNERHARKIEAGLPEARRAEFRRLFDQASYPMVFRRSKAARHLEAGLALKDLKPGQMEQFAAAKAGYERDSKALNEAWVKEVQAADVLEHGDWLYPSSAGSPVLLHLGEGQKPGEEAAKARRALDRATVDRVLAVLTDEQRAVVSEQEKKNPEDNQWAEDGGTE